MKTIIAIYRMIGPTWHQVDMEGNSIEITEKKYRKLRLNPNAQAVPVWSGMRNFVLEDIRLYKTESDESSSE